MKKNILILLITFFGFSSSAFSAACTTSSGKTVLPSSTGFANACSIEPDHFEVKIYELMLCTAAPTPPTTSSPAVTTSCQLVMSSITGSDVVVATGVTSPIIATIKRPDNGTYTHAFVRINNTFTLGDSREYSASINGYDGGTNGSGAFCATSSGGTKCAASALPVVNKALALDDFKPGSNLYSIATTDAEGVHGAYLVDSAFKLEADTDADTKFLVGMQQFSTPVTVTDNSSSMNIAFSASTGMQIFNNGSSTIYSVMGPFALKLTVK